MPSGRIRTSPRTRTTHSARRSCATPCASVASSGWKTTCTEPSRSRRSMNVTPPWSRRCATHPHRTTSRPASAPRSSPHACVRIAVANADRSVMRRPSRPRPRPRPAAPRVCSPSREPPERHGARGELGVADDRSEACRGAVGHLELRLERPFLVRQIGGEPRVAELAHEARGRRARRLGERDDVHVERRLAGRGDALVPQRDQHALETHAEADARHVRTAEQLRHPVVPSAAEQGGLLGVAALLHRVGNELERGAHVVVEAPDDRAAR